MMYLKKMTDEELDRLSDIVDTVNPLVKHIKKTWNWLALKPKKFKDYTPDMDRDDEILKGHLASFKGIVDRGPFDSGFVENTFIANVAVNNDRYKIDPLTSLIASSVAFGSRLQEERLNRKAKKEKEKRLADFDKMANLIRMDIKASCTDPTKGEQLSASIEYLRDYL